MGIDLWCDSFLFFMMVFGDNMALRYRVCGRRKSFMNRISKGRAATLGRSRWDENYYSCFMTVDVDASIMPGELGLSGVFLDTGVFGIRGAGDYLVFHPTL